MAKIPEEVLDVLSQCRAEGNVLFLPAVQLDRKLYTAVNKVLENMGGKWNRKEKGHVFSDGDPAEMLEVVLLTQEVRDLKKEFQFFPTPKPVIDRLCELCELDKIGPATVVMEPSCGDGRMVDAIMEYHPGGLVCFELNPGMAKHLDSKPYAVEYIDFMTVTREELGALGVDRVVMNPPFTRLQDVDHIRHAFELMNEGGILVSVVSESPFFRTDKKSVEFRDFLEENGAEVYDLDAGAFHERGTEIKTRLVKIVK